MEDAPFFVNRNAGKAAKRQGDQIIQIKGLFGFEIYPQSGPHRTTIIAEIFAAVVDYAVVADVIDINTRLRMRGTQPPKITTTITYRSAICLCIFRRLALPPNHVKIEISLRLIPAEKEHFAGIGRRYCPLLALIKRTVANQAGKRAGKSKSKTI